MLKRNFTSRGMVFIATVQNTDDPLLPCTCPHPTSGTSVMWLWISKTPCTPLLLLHHLNVPTFIFSECLASFEGVSEGQLFSLSYKTGRAEVFTSLSVTCTFLCACICVCSLEVMENMNVKKFYYDVLPLIHCVHLVSNIPLFIHKLFWK